ncbi:MAG: sucrose phosphorylase, partial [Aquiluna sp.]
IAPLVDLIYDFQTAPLLLHSIFTSTVDRLSKWFEMRPANCLNVLDTHDGYGVIDAGPIGGKPGLITQAEMAHIFEVAAQNTAGHSKIASVVPQWFELPHQINATLPSIVADDNAYLLCRAVQVFLPGEPQIYYVGLLNGEDDIELFQQTGQGRDVNRHHYSAEEIAETLETPVTKAILGLVRLRRLEVFEGEFSYQQLSDNSMVLSWSKGSDRVSLSFELTGGSASFEVTTVIAGQSQSFSSFEQLANI